MDKEPYKPSAIRAAVSQEVERAEKEGSFHIQVK